MSLFRDRSTGPERGSLYRDIWRLAWPAFLAQGVRSVVMLISRAIVAQLGETAFNAVNVGMMIFMVIITLIAAVAVGTTALVAQAWGAGDKERAGRILQQSVLWGAVLSVNIAILGMPVSRLLFFLLGADAETVALGEKFMIWLFAALPLLALGFFLAAGLRAAGDTRTPMVAGIIMGVVSLVLSYGLILGKLHMPKLGIIGAALAIDISFFSFSLFLAVLFMANKTVLKLPLRGWRFDNDTGISIFRIGIPSAMEWILIQLGILMYVVVIYKYGDAAAAGYFVGMTILGFAQTPAFGFQTAAATLVGQSVGARDMARAESSFRHCGLLSFMVMALIGVLIYFLITPASLGWMFGRLSAESIGFARTYAILIAFVMPLMGISFSVAGGLRGAGDTVPPLVASAVGVYGGRILLAFAVYYLFHPPVFVIWCSMFPDLCLRLLVMALRLRSGKWKRPKI
jgi:putative MATE family efflux protein